VLGCKKNKERCTRESVRRTHRLKVSEDGPRDNWWFCQRGRWYPNRSLVERAFGGQVILILSFYFNYSNARVWASGSGTNQPEQVVGVHSQDFGRLCVVSISLLDGPLDQHLLRFANALCQRIHGLP